jgi:hypothetical protein
MCRLIAVGAVVSALLGSAGCGASPEPETPTRSVRDSAGVRIVEHASLPNELTSWTLSETQLRIGSLDGAGPEVFGRITDVVELTSGTMVVADDLARELRSFDATGRHLWTAGGQGDGPGELARIDALGVLRGDSVAVFDSRNRRVSIFGDDGLFARDYALALPAGLRTPQSAGITGRGGLAGLSLEPGFPPDPGPFQLAMDPLFIDPEGRLLVRGPSIPGGDYLRPPSMNGPVAPLLWRPLGRRTQIAVGSESVLLATQHSFEVRRYSLVGRLIESVRVHQPLVPTDRARYEAMDRARYPTMDRRPDRFLPDSLPAFDRIRLDILDRTWIEEYVPPYETRAPQWWVLDNGGDFLAQIRIPTDFVPYVITEDYIIGVTVDSLGVGYVERRGITR